VCMLLLWLGVVVGGRVVVSGVCVVVVGARSQIATAPTLSTTKRTPPTTPKCRSRICSA